MPRRLRRQHSHHVEQQLYQQVFSSRFPDLPAGPESVFQVRRPLPQQQLWQPQTAQVLKHSWKPQQPRSCEPPALPPRRRTAPAVWPAWPQRQRRLRQQKPSHPLEQQLRQKVFFSRLSDLPADPDSASLTRKPVSQQQPWQPRTLQALRRSSKLPLQLCERGCRAPSPSHRTASASGPAWPLMLRRLRQQKPSLHLGQPLIQEAFPSQQPGLLADPPSPFVVRRPLPQQQLWQPQIAQARQQSRTPRLVDLPRQVPPPPLVEPLLLVQPPLPAQPPPSSLHPHPLVQPLLQAQPLLLVQPPLLA
mmetsp:Transcript_27090/g.49750  ORF Transcript_27090/g.49750 Transcript_27090/m.49750 type:complete len:305 (+) Transcript_27090:296-1210(+)